MACREDSLLAWPGAILISSVLAKGMSHRRRDHPERGLACVAGPRLIDDCVPSVHESFLYGDQALLYLLYSVWLHG